MNMQHLKFVEIGKKISDLFGSILEKQDPNLNVLEEVHHLSNFLPYKWYDDETRIFISDKHVGFVIETIPLCGNSETMQRELSNIFTQILPEDSSIQTMIYADKNIDNILNQYVDVRQKSSDTMQRLAIRRSKYMRSLALKSHLSPYVLRDFRCFMSVSINITESLEKSLQEIETIKKKIDATLSVVGIGYLIIDAEDIIKLLDSILNIDFRNTKRPTKTWNRYDNISDQILSYDTDIVVAEDLLTLRRGTSEIKTFSVSHYPPEWTLYQMSELIGDMFRDSRQFPFPFIIHYGVYIQKQSNDVAKITVKAGMVERQLNSPLGKHIPNIEREHAELTFAQDALNKGERLVKTQFNVVLFSPKNEMQHAEQILKTMFAPLSFLVESNVCTHLHSLLAILPLAWHRDTIKILEEFKKLRTTLSTESANLIPQQGEWKGTPTPAMLFGGRRGQLMTFCPFDNTAGNYNVTVVGRSGAGKSVFMQELMASTMGLGGRVFVLDVGRSFEKTCYMLEGQFIEFSKNSGLVLNPFSDLDINNYEAVEDTLAMLKSVIQMMAAPINGVDDKGAALLEQATNEAFKAKKNDTTITDIANFLLSQNDEQARDLGQMLYPYTEHGAYGKYFNGKSNVNLDNSLIVIELEELKEKKDLCISSHEMRLFALKNYAYEYTPKESFRPEQNAVEKHYIFQLAL